ncbi:MAG TPA: hypothetical protein VLV45_02850 [Gemmatimonadales bacterium]|jgi:hypothetical protein|nr:hypothetical protein [Gemmatimonadales bacterium]
MTSLPLVLDEEPLGIILSAGRKLLRPARIWAYCWCADEDDAGAPPHLALPIDPHPA